MIFKFNSAALVCRSTGECRLFEEKLNEEAELNCSSFHSVCQQFFQDIALKITK